MLKVRCFKTTGDNRPFLSNFDVKLGSSGIIHTGETSPLEVSIKPVHSPSGVQRNLRTRREAPSLMGRVGGLDGISKVSFKFLYTL